MSNYIEYAKRELERGGFFDDDGMYGDLVGKAVMKLIEVHAAEGHSGMSNGLVVNLFSRVAQFKPLSKLTGEDEEWNEVEDGLYQNNRMSSVFKNKDGAYFIDAIVWKTPSGACFSGTIDGISGKWNIEFPFAPKTFYINVDENDNIVDPSQLVAVKEYYPLGQHK